MCILFLKLLYKVCGIDIEEVHGHLSSVRVIFCENVTFIKSSFIMLLICRCLGGENVAILTIHDRTNRLVQGPDLAVPALDRMEEII